MSAQKTGFFPAGIIFVENGKHELVRGQDFVNWFQDANEKEGQQPF